MPNNKYWDKCGISEGELVYRTDNCRHNINGKEIMNTENETTDWGRK